MNVKGLTTTVVGVLLAMLLFELARYGIKKISDMADNDDDDDDKNDNGSN